MAHSTGQGTSTFFSVYAFEASETDTPSLTSVAAALRFAGVTRFSVPSSSSLPHRPQFVSSVRHRSYSACVIRACDGGLCVAVARENTLAAPAAVRKIVAEMLIIGVLMMPSRRGSCFRLAEDYTSLCPYYVLPAF